MSLSTAPVAPRVPPDPESKLSTSQSLTTSGSPVAPKTYPTVELSSDPKRLRTTPSRSQRLETFEDLLKEAGYSHTRVVTPKSERLAKDAATYSSHTREESLHKDVRGVDSALAGAARYAARVANFLAWVSGGSTSAPAVERGDSQRESANNSKLLQEAQRDQLSTLTEVRRTGVCPGHPHSPSGRRVQPKRRLPTSSSNGNSIGPISPSPSSDTIKATLTTTSTTTVRPPSQAQNLTPPIRHAASSPQLQPSPSSGATGPNAPNLSVSKRVPLHKSNQNSHRSNVKPGSFRHTKRSPLPETWKSSSRTTGRVPRGHRPSEKLLARSGSQSVSTSSAATISGRIQVVTSPVTVSCRSSSVGAAPRHRRKKELPLLAPSTESGAWPWTAERGGSMKGGKVLPLLQINLHAANGRQPLTRTASSSSAKGFSSLSRNGSAYTMFSRVGSHSPYASISRGTSGGTSSHRGAGEESSWAEYSFRNSPVLSGYKHLPPPNLHSPQHPDEIDDDSGDEPHLCNILAPHLSHLPDASPDVTIHAPPGPVGRQRSIQSLRDCLRRHKSASSSRVTSPNVAIFSTDPHAGPNSAKLDSETAQNQVKRRSVGHYDQRRGHDPRVSPSRREANRVFDEEGERGIRRTDGLDSRNETTERGRSDSRGLPRLGFGGLKWSASSSRSPPYSTPPPPLGLRGARTNSTPARGHDKGGKRDDKTNQKELERERLLWGTSWGRG